MDGAARREIRGTIFASAKPRLTEKKGRTLDLQAKLEGTVTGKEAYTSALADDEEQTEGFILVITVLSLFFH